MPRLEPRASVRLTGRGALASLFALCFVTQLIADWTGWGTLAGAAFVCGCGAVTYYTRTSGMRAVVVTPPRPGSGVMNFQAIEPVRVLTALTLP